MVSPRPIQRSRVELKVNDSYSEPTFGISRNKSEIQGLHMRTSTAKYLNPLSDAELTHVRNEYAPIPVFMGHHEVSKKWHRGVYAIGNFDGLHIGHQALIEKAIQIAAETSCRPAILTFDPHPRELFDAAAVNFRLGNSLQKTQDLANLGTGFCVNQHFDLDFAALTPVEFVKEVLSKSLSASHVVVGTDFKFGCRQAGNTEILKELCAQRDIGITVLEQIRFEGKVVSSSLIRDLLRKGEMEAASGLLGRPWTVMEMPYFQDGQSSFDLSGYTELKEGDYEVRIDGIACRANLAKMEDGEQILGLPTEWPLTSSNNMIVEFLS